MASDAMLELILFVRERGWRLELDREAIVGGHDKFVVTTTETATGAVERGVGGGKEDQEGEGCVGRVGGDGAPCGMTID